MHLFVGLSLDLPQVDLMNFRVEYVFRPRRGRCLGREAAERATKSREVVRRVLNKQDEGLFRKSRLSFYYSLKSIVN